jgi:broad specificity phosphatase PhoE
MSFQSIRLLIQRQFAFILALALTFVLISFLDVSALANAQPTESNPITTILLVRHADRGPDDSLTPDGVARANELVHVLEKANIKAIFRTNTLRSKQTVQPLADVLSLTPIEYAYPSNNYQDLTNPIFSSYIGQVVFVASHTDTLGAIIKALNGNPDNCRLSGNEFDNLCVISVGKSNQTSVVNLQYGKASP